MERSTTDPDATRRERTEPTRERDGEWAMGNVRIFSIATAAVVALNLGAVTVSSADAAQRGGSERCVAVSGGTVENATVLDVVADGGTSISDASGGTGNLAADSGGNHDRNNNNHRNNNNGNNNNNNRNKNRNNWSAESLQSFELRLLQTDTASAGNAGVATSSADGGAVSIGDVNSGGNAGNAIAIGDTVCPGAVKNASGGKAPAGNTSGGGRGGQVRVLPSTGIGMGETGSTGSLLLALGALGMTGLSLASRLDRRVSFITGR
jgi:hypothetical protein